MCVPSVSAHSGKTDPQGGHNSPSGYHYHHGYPAHQHINGTCPYDFDDKTNHKSSGNNGTKKTSDNFTVADAKASASFDNIGIISGIIILACGLIPLLFWIVIFIKAKIGNMRSQKRYLKKQSELIEEYHNKIASEVFYFPENCQINDQGIPLIDGVAIENIYVCISKSGNKYHTEHCKYGHTKISVLELSDSYQPCSICHPIDLGWYRQYKIAQQILKQYNIQMTIKGGKIQILKLNDNV